MSKALAELLLKDRIITQPQFDEAAGAQKDGKGYVRHLIEKKYIAETKLLFYLCQKFGLPSINLEKFEISQAVLDLLSMDLVRRHQAIPIQSSKGVLVVAVCDPTHLSGLESLKFAVKLNIEAVLTSYSAFDFATQKYYGAAAFVGSAIETFQKEAKAEIDGGNIEFETSTTHSIDAGGVDSNDAPVIQLVNGLLSESIRKGASDIHMEPYEKRFRVRMRIDGSLHDLLQIPQEMRRAVIARIKVMSRMDIAESRIPQDGRIKLKLGMKEIDFRVSSMPTLFGEKIVMRILNKGSLQLDLKKLGFETRQLEQFQKGIYAPNGMVLVTGPTGSGKTTTLYSALIELNKSTDNISTVEDPVEYNLEGINQVQVNKDIGLTFASVLRTLLRQDPDTILVGEIRDFETAEVAIQAALTGHMVLSTLHTNDAPSSITRLVNMGIEPFLVVSALNAVVAQRLLRTICPKCKVDAPVPKEKLVQLGFSAEAAGELKLFRGAGCPACSESGYKGRVAIYEVLDFSQNLKEMVLRGESIIELRKQAIVEGMKSLRMSALTKTAMGMTSLEEAISSTSEN